MKLLIKISILVAMLFFSVTGCVMAKNGTKESDKFSVAVVDVQQIIQKSPKISALQAERQSKLNDLEKFVINARKDVAKQKTEKARKTLETKYNKELNNRKNDIDNDYSKKLAEIDKEITALIKEKSTDYDLVLTKNTVINGGVDITSEIIKELK